MDKFEERRLALLRLVTQMGRGGRIKVATAIGKTPDYISRMLYPGDKPGKKGIGEDSVDLLNAAFPHWLKSEPSKDRQVNEGSASYPVSDWPFLSVKQEEWNRIPFSTRQMLEMQIKSLVPAIQQNDKAA